MAAMLDPNMDLNRRRAATAADGSSAVASLANLYGTKPLPSVAPDTFQKQPATTAPPPPVGTIAPQRQPGAQVTSAAPPLPAGTNAGAIPAPPPSAFQAPPPPAAPGAAGAFGAAPGVVTAGTGTNAAHFTVDSSGKIVGVPEAPTGYNGLPVMTGAYREGVANLGAQAQAAGNFALGQGAQMAESGAAIEQQTGDISSDLMSQALGPRQQVSVLSGADPNKAQDTTLARLRSFNADPGTSAAEASVRDQANQSFANSLSLARSGGTASERAWNQRAAVAQNFEREAQTGRTLATMRLDEQERAKTRELSALGAEAGVAQGVDTTQLNAGTAQANVDLQRQQLADQYKLGSQELGVSSLLQGEQLAAQQQQQATNAGLMGYQLPYQAQQDINASTFAEAQIAQQALAREQGLSLQVDAANAQKDALPWQIGASVLGTAGGMAAMLSDVRAKTDVVPTFDASKGAAAGQAAGRSAAIGAANELAADDAAAGERRRQGIGMMTSSLQGLMGNIGGAVSDEGAKSTLKRLRDDEAAKAVEASPGYSYRYKPGMGQPTDETFVGPMAQDLEKTKFGGGLVHEGPDGFKRIDTDRVALLDHAALGSVLERLRRLEGRKAA